MIVKFGFWNIQTEPEEMFGEKFYLCKHKDGFGKSEVVFVTDNGLEGKKELVEFIEKEILE